MGFRTKIEEISVIIYEWIKSHEAIEPFCKNLNVPNEYKDLILLFSNCASEFQTYQPNSPEEYDKLLSLIKKIDIRKKDRLSSFMKYVYYFCGEPDGHKNFFEELIKNINTITVNAIIHASPYPIAC